MKNKPLKLSIITINYNNKDGLRKTIESVMTQTVKDFEYIIIDGGSTDGSVEVIKEYEKFIDYWVSEPDKGIYNAMNKGVAVAHGEYCQFLNSGDWLYEDRTIQEVLPSLNCNIDFLCGYMEVVKLSGEISTFFQGTPKRLSIPFFLKGSISHQATFTKTRLLLKRPFNENYKIVSDWIFFFECFLYDNIIYQKINKKIAWYDGNGICINNLDLLNQERINFINSIINYNLLKPFLLVPNEIVEFFNQYPYSYKYHKLILKFITLSSFFYKRARIKK